MPSSRAPSPSPVILLSIARAQSAPARVMLEYLSLSLLPTPLAELKSGFLACCEKLDLYPLAEYPEDLLDSLLREGLVQNTGEGLVCHPELLEDVAAEAVSGGRIAALCQVCLAREVRRRPGALTYQERLRSLRLVLYGNLERPAAIDELGPTLRNFPTLISDVGQGFLETASLDAFPRNIAFYLCYRSLEALTPQAQDAPVLRAWLGQLAERVAGEPNEVVHGLLQMTQLVRGDLADHQRLAQEGTSLVSLFAAACSGGTLSPLDSDKLPKLHWHFQKVFLAGCLMAQGRHAKLLELAHWGDYEVNYYERAIVKLLYKVSQYPHTELPHFLEDFDWDPDWEPAWHVCTALAWSWLGLDNELHSISDALLEACQTFMASGHTLLADVAREILRRLAEQEPRPCPLLDLVRPVPQWEQRLTELSHWAARQREKSDLPKEGAQRLIWVVERRGSKLKVTPKTQKLKKNGQWSAGRGDRLISLAQGQPMYGEEQDHRALRAAETAFYVPPGGDADEAALLELVGHPRVYYEEKDKLRPISVMRGQPRLRLKKKGTEMMLRIEPKPGKRATVQVVAEADRITLYSLTEDQLELSHLLGSEWLTVPQEREAEVRDIASAAARLNLVLDSDLRLGSEEVTVAANNTLRLRLAPDGDGLTGKLLVRPFGTWGPTFEPGKGGQSVSAEREGVTHHAERDLKAEKASVKTARAALPELAGNFTLETALESLQFLESLQHHLGPNLAVEWPEGQVFELTATKSLNQMSIAVSQERDWFTMEGTLEIDENEVVTLQQLLALASESKERFLTLGSGKYLALTEEFRARLDQLSMLTEKAAKGRVKASPLVAAVAFPELLPKDGPWSQRREHLEQSEKLAPRLPKGLQAELRSYQKDGFTWMARLAHWDAGACLADDMGLGKTVQTLAILLRRSAQGPALVIAPTSVCQNWSDEAARFAPELKVRILAEGDRRAALFNLGPGDVVLCSYGLLVNESQRLQEVHWATAILDEAQYIKNATTLRFKAAVALKADFRLATTGTPIENHLEELWSLFAFLNPGLLGARSLFISRFVRPIAGGDSRAKEILRKLIHPFILRRNKSDVLTELPAKTEITHTVELSPKEMALYESLRQEALESMARTGGQLFAVLTSLTKLRRACCHPSLVLPGTTLPGSKLEAFSELVDELRGGGHRALVFSQFVDHLAIVRAHLDTRGISYRYLDGSTPAKKRRDEVAAFQAGQGELFLISLKAGGVGLNLTAADYVIHLDPWWNPAVEDQASDRAHRMGQTRPVTVYRLVTAGTIEQKIVALHSSKRDLAEKLLSGTDKATKLDVHELMELMGQS